MEKEEEEDQRRIDGDLECTVSREANKPLLGQTKVRVSTGEPTKGDSSRLPVPDSYLVFDGFRLFAQHLFLDLVGERWHVHMEMSWKRASILPYFAIIAHPLLGSFQQPQSIQRESVGRDGTQRVCGQR